MGRSKQRTHRRRTYFTALWLALGGAGYASAADIIWDNSSGGTFNASSNWNGGAVPGTNDIADFEVVANGSGPTYTVNFTGDTTTAGAYVHRDNVTWNLGGHTFTLSGVTGADTFGVARPNNGQVPFEVGTLTITNGTFITNGASTIGNASDPPVISPETGTVNIGSDANWMNNGTETVGEFNATNGSVNQSSGTHSVEGRGNGVSNLNGGLVLGYGAFCTGTYSLSGSGVLFVKFDEIIGASNLSYGTFMQSGGTHTINNFGGLSLGVSPGAAGSYTLSGGTLSAETYEDIGGLGSGTFTQTGGTNTTGSLSVASGQTGSTGSYVLSGTGMLAVTNVSVSVNFNGAVYLPSSGGGKLTINSGGAMTVTGMARIWNTVNTVFSINGTGYMDLTQGQLLFDSSATGLASDYTTLRNYITGKQIRSSFASSITGLALVNASDYILLHGSDATFGGRAVSANDILVQYTYLGDANLDGKIDATDYAQIDASFLLGNFDGVNNIAKWVNGDFNYDGVVNYKDYALIDAAYASQSGTLANAIIAEHIAEFGEEYMVSLQSIESVAPEPSAIVILVLGSTYLLLIRRKYAGVNGG